MLGPIQGLGSSNTGSPTTRQRCETLFRRWILSRRRATVETGQPVFFVARGFSRRGAFLGQIDGLVRVLESLRIFILLVQRQGKPQHRNRIHLLGKRVNGFAQVCLRVAPCLGVVFDCADDGICFRFQKRLVERDLVGRQARCRNVRFHRGQGALSVFLGLVNSLVFVQVRVMGSFRQNRGDAYQRFRRTGVGRGALG